MKSADFIKPYLPEYEPCFGCASATCKSCGEFSEERLAISGERNQKDHRPKKAAQPKANAKKAAADTNRKTNHQTGLPTDIPVNPNGDLPPLPQMEILEWVRMPKRIFGDMENSLIATADGDGMCNAGIRHGDYLVFNRIEPKDGDIVLVTVENQTMCRRVFINGGMYRIRREDGITPDIITENCTFHGVLESVIHFLRRVG